MASVKVEIPIVDIQGYLAGDAPATNRAVQQVRSALENVGFIILTGHGINWSIVAEAFAQAKRFFDLPTERKQEVSLGNGKADANMNIIEKKGYIFFEGASQHVKVKDTRDKNSVESLFFGYESSGQNQWPRDLEGFQKNIQNYHDVIDDLSLRLLPLFALSLGQDANFFADAFHAPLNVLRLSHNMPAEPGEDTTDRWGFLAHTDQNFFTLLPANEVAGLQIRTSAGEWIPAPHVSESFVLNSGDMLRHWSNGLFLSTPHRVLKPKAHRYALPFFVSPGPEVVLSPIGDSVEPDRAGAFDSITVMEHFKRSFFKRDIRFLDNGADAEVASADGV